ncbi:hypothetical protein A2856_02435 [Candidatus Uhrbacteria bacterium RIFCSPHIGHO2_01_FULL_63_20]|uniref:Vitamin K epoxide reductase domain-containing protein n=1 Tax=Candidatus Uhrbacteria bacterium RIFCSPHIGHO2_01_FULL_63_20 TaxID=1802385 RepID=A0A1F7TKK9_9BACT|nr:MAG: hypothetical protein A2856_02435 [Candidatus Uhrbacteria bacterium RIFCSPHIGHO2_01_FULL_63_20]
MEGKDKHVLHLVMLLAVLGLAISTYAFLHNRGFSSGSFCTIGESFDCDVVNKGPYSVLFGIPVALIGILGYLFLLAAALLKRRDMRDRNLTRILLAAAAGGTAFALYLTGIEAFVLRVWCLLCISSQVSILLILVLSYSLWHAEREPSPPSTSSTPS